MANEETPLLSNDHNCIYERFSPREKRVLVAIVSWTGLLSFFTSATFIPTIPQVARDLNTTGDIISYTISMNIFANCLGGLFGSQYAKFYGRRPCYLWCLPVTIVGSLGVARAHTVGQLISWQFVQAAGAAPSLAIGSAMIGDIYKLEERGAALGSYLGTGLLGLALSPTIGGVTAYYLSWRAVQYGLAAFGLSALFCIFWSLPETSHPGTLGVDEYKKSGGIHPKKRPILLNPFKQLRYLRGPNVFAIAIMCSLFLLTDFTLLVPFTLTTGRRYGIENEGLAGLCFLPLGIGNAIGAPLSGWISDRVLIKYKKRRGYWYPEDRLRACLYGSFLPLTVLASALITRYIPGRLGLALNLICFFVNGVGTDIALIPCGAYIVDILHSNSAGATAAVSALRSFTLAFAVGMLLPTINRYGHLFTSVIISFLAFSSFLVIRLIIAYGGFMRAWVDVGYVVEERY